MKAPMAPFYGDKPPLKNGDPDMNAAAQINNLENSPDYRQVSPEEATQLANDGNFVVGGALNPDPNGPAHVDTVRPEGVKGDPEPFGKHGPLLNDIGAHDRIARQSGAFTKDMDVHYYTPK